MASLIASKTAAENSADFTLADGQSAMLNLTQGASGGPALGVGCSASIQLKTSEGSYIQVGELTEKDPVLQVFGPGTYRVAKKASAAAFGVDKS